MNIVTNALKCVVKFLTAMLSKFFFTYRVKIIQFVLN